MKHKTKKDEIERLRTYITPLEGECQLDKEPWPGQCCCQCLFLLIDYWYCCRMPPELKPNKGEGCGCGVVRGYICITGEIHGDKSGQSGWPHHSCGCECFTKRAEAIENLTTNS